MKHFNLLLVLAIVLMPTVLRADGENSVSDGQNVLPDTGQTNNQVTKSSNASFDKRLPPVLPGEEVGTGRNRMKVWSTSGSVSANPAPQPPSAPEPWNGNGTSLGPVGVIVDQRGGARGISPGANR